MFNYFTEMMKIYTENMNKVNTFFDSVINHDDTSWEHDFDVSYEDDYIRVLKFSDGSKTPRVIFPPRAGHDPTIAKRVVGLYKEMKNTPVYAITFKPATQETKHVNFENLIDISHVGILSIISTCAHDNVHLTGLCQGGWMTTMYTAVYQQFVKTMVIEAAPIDFIIGGGKIQQGNNMISVDTVKSIVDMNAGIWPGQYQLIGFKMLNPYDRFWGTYSDLWNHILSDDDKEVKKWKRNNDWYEKAEDLPGDLLVSIKRDLFTNNDLIKGRVMYNDSPVLLENITCPVTCVTGGNDDITSVEQCTALFDYVSSDLKIHKHIEEAGHIAVFLIGKALKMLAEAIEEMDNK